MWHDAGVIYVGSCAGANGQPCAGRYVGETARTLSQRVDEHFSTALRCPGQCKSSVMQHARDLNHHFRKSDFGIVGVEDDWFRRGVKESIYIRALRPSINENPGRHFLPPNYDPILEANIKKPAAAAVHNSETEEILNTAPRRPGRPRRIVSSSSQTTPMEVIPPQQHNNNNNNNNNSHRTSWSLGGGRSLRDPPRVPLSDLFWSLSSFPSQTNPSSSSLSSSP